MAQQSQHRREDYKVGWVCALAIELAAAEEVLDQVHDGIEHETNIYTLGRIGKHNVVIACLPEGQTGTNSAAAVAVQMKSAFKSIRFGLMVGIGGGVPSAEADIRLGDVVVSTPNKRYGGVVQYDFGKATPSGFERTGFLSPPPDILLNSVTKVRANRMRGRSKLYAHVTKLETLPGFARQKAGLDTLYEADYDHEGGANCSNCSNKRVVDRTQRDQVISVHHGTIASGNQVMRNATERDKVSSELGGVLCFEMEAAGLMKNFPCLVIRGICDYADSHKNKTWQPYAAATAAAYAKEVLEMIPVAEVVESSTAEVITSGEILLSAQETRARNEKIKRFLKMLYTCPYRDRKNRNSDRIPGTCEWFTSHPLFQDWNKSQNSSLLWVSADPGCGKSVLVKYLIDHVLPTTIDRTTCYFFFKDDFTDQKTATNALCAILRQIFLAKPHLLIDSILDTADRDGEHYAKSFHDLWSTLLSIATDQDAGEIVCVLDALDECQENHRSRLISAIQQFYLANPHKSHLKFLLTSRGYDHIRREFGDLKRRLPTIHLSGEDEAEVEKISREIDLVIHKRVEDISRERVLNQSELMYLQEQLTLVPNRTYLWVSLTLDVIKNIPGFTKGNVRKAIRKLPQTVDEAYDKILGRSSDADKARTLLHVIVAARKPLSLREMSLILAIEGVSHSDEDIMEELEPEDRFQSTLRDLCGLFVVTVDGKIYLLHQTAKEFLVQDASGLGFQDPTLTWKHSLHSLDSNRILAERCIWYLLSDFTQYHLKVLVDYAALNWVAHFRKAGVPSANVIQLARDLCDTETEHYKVWSKKYSHPVVLLPASNSLILASLLGLESVVKLLLEADGVDVNFKDDIYYKTPLSWASTAGNVSVVKLLIEVEGVDLNCRGRADHTPLSLAARHGNRVLVRMLLATRQTDVNMTDMQGQSALSFAAEMGNDTIVKDLLEVGEADINSRDLRGRTPLSYAASGGHNTTLKTLLENGKIEVNSRDLRGQTPLSNAAQEGNEGAVWLLLVNGEVDINLADYQGQTALSHAAESGHRGVVEMLLKTGKADVSLKDRHGRTALSYARKHELEAMMELLERA